MQLLLYLKKLFLDKILSHSHFLNILKGFKYLFRDNFE